MMNIRTSVRITNPVLPKVPASAVLVQFFLFQKYRKIVLVLAWQHRTLSALAERYAGGPANRGKERTTHVQYSNRSGEISITFSIEGPIITVKAQPVLTEPL